jgi:uncharacterized protein
MLSHKLEAQMAKMVFINLPVSDLKRSMAFYDALGFTNNPQFTDDTAACMVWSESVFLMILTHEKFDGFVKRPRPDAKATTGALYALSLEARADVDTMFNTAEKNGGRAYRDTEDMGFMYTRTFADPDGHVWEPFFMDMSKMPKS